MLSSGDLQGPEEVLQAGFRGGLLRPRQHGNHGRVLHAKGHQGRGGECALKIFEF